MINFILAAVVAYFFGSLPSGVWIGKWAKNIDIREYGSKNSGATNAYRVLGAKYGIIVLILDALKGFVPLVLAETLFKQSGSNLIILAVVAILGHTLSIFLNFKGGKGVATSLGVFAFLFPKGILIVFILFVLIVSLTKYVSLGSIIGAGLLPILALVIDVREGIPKWPMVGISVLIGAFVIYKHKANIVRLKNGTENKFGSKK